MTGRISLDLNIRRVRTEEMERLRDISISTFFDTYERHNTAENMRDHAAKAFSKIRLQAELNSKNIEYYFAENEGELVGYLRVNYGDEQTNQSLSSACEVERIYVVAKFQGQKIGKLLLDHAVQCAKELGLNWVWLGVWYQNENAIGFYKNMGFEVFASHDSTLGTEEQTDFLMRIRIQTK